MEPGKLEWASSRAFERITEAYVALDAQWRCTYVNAAAAALLGRRADSLLGKRIWTEFPQPEARPFREACEQAMAEQRPRTVETWLAPVGRWFEGCIYPAPDGLTVRVQEITERKREAQRLQAQRRLLNQAQQLAMVGSWSWDVAADRVHWSDELFRIYGVAPTEHAATFDAYLSRVHPDDSARVQEIIRQAVREGGSFEFEERIIRPDGEERTLYSRGVAETDADGRVLRLQGVCRDITARKRNEELLAGQHEILLGIAAQQPLEESLARIAQLHEAQNPGAMCSLLLLDADGRHVLHGAAPSLPEAYNRAIHGQEIGEGRGSCGTAAWRCERVVVADIATHPYWAGYKEVALAHGLRACWSTPIQGSHGEVLGTFAVYYRTPREPSAQELADIDRMLPIAGIAIESERLLGRLRERNRFFEMAQEVFCILDPRSGKLVQFNDYLQRLTGCSAEELRGRNFREFLLPLAGDIAPYAAADHTAPTPATLTRCVAKDGSEHLLEWAAFAAPGGLLYAVAHDVTARHRAEQELLHEVNHDAITGLPRRAQLEHALTSLLQAGTLPVWVLMVGLDRFQVVNESVGHVIGDDALHQVGDRLRRALDAAWPIARVAGDKYAMLALGLDQPGVLALAERLRAEVARPIEGHDYRLLLTASIGISRAPEHGDTPAALLRGAEAALSLAKREGRDRVVVFSLTQRQALEERILLGSHLRDAVRRAELELYYQPQFNALDQALTGFEALLRWNSAELGRVMPTNFIPIAEALGLMPEIGVWIFDQAARQIRDWLDRGYRGFTVALNVSAQQMQHPHLVAQVDAALRRHRVPPAMLDIEMTESALMENVARIRSALAGLKALGVQLSLDDFGTGYSSLAYLKQFPIDKLKVDQSFVRELPDNASDGAIVQTIVELGHQLGMLVAAEGVETPAQAAFLAGLGCDELQGNSLGAAAPLAEAERHFGAARNAPESSAGGLT
jgi:diguanylate cyclase (GGDEF)-like protein/PAS domain S-box-containing protein